MADALLDGLLDALHKAASASLRQRHKKNGA